MAQRLQDHCHIHEGAAFWVRDLPKTAEELRKYPPFEFENWAVNALDTVISNGQAIANRAKAGDKGIDGHICPASTVEEKQSGYDLFRGTDRWYPVQVKQQTKETGKVGRPDIDAFETAMKRQRRDKGVFIAFDFTTDALQEIKRAAREEDLEIIPIQSGKFWTKRYTTVYDRRRAWPHRCSLTVKRGRNLPGRPHPCPNKYSPLCFRTRKSSRTTRC